MKLGIGKLMEAINSLDPATDKRVRSITLSLTNGQSITTDDAMVDTQGLIFARDDEDADRWHYLHRDEVVAVSVMLNRAECAAANTDPTLPGVLSRRAKR